jgi:hypothetical protein
MKSLQKSPGSIISVLSKPNTAAATGDQIINQSSELQSKHRPDGIQTVGEEREIQWETLEKAGGTHGPQ